MLSLHEHFQRWIVHKLLPHTNETWPLGDCSLVFFFCVRLLFILWLCFLNGDHVNFLFCLECLHSLCLRCLLGKSRYLVHNFLEMVLKRTLSIVFNVFCRVFSKEIVLIVWLPDVLVHIELYRVHM